MLNTGIGSQQIATPQPEGISSDLSSAESRLLKLADRLYEIGNQIAGPRPESATGGNDAPAPMPSLASRSRNIHQILARAEDLVTRIEQSI